MSTRDQRPARLLGRVGRTRDVREALGLAGARGLARSAGEAPRACLRRPWRWLASIAAERYSAGDVESLLVQTHGDGACERRAG